jgi:site-specific DNA recombinase
MRKIILFERCSTTEQTNTIKNQHDTLLKYCSLKEIIPTDTFVEFGISGGSLKGRDKFVELMDLIGQGQVQQVITQSLSRITRNTMDLLQFVELCKENNTDLVVLKENIELNTPTGMLFLTILGSLYSYERDLIKMRTKDILQHKKKNNVVYSRTPYGFDRVGDKLVENPVEVRMIKKVNKMKDNGKSYNEIKDFLNRNGYKTKKNQSNFTRSNVISLLKNHPITNGFIDGR